MRFSKESYVDYKKLAATCVYLPATDGYFSWDIHERSGRDHRTCNIRLSQKIRQNHWCSPSRSGQYHHTCNSHLMSDTAHDRFHCLRSQMSLPPQRYNLLRNDLTHRICSNLLKSDTARGHCLFRCLFWNCRMLHHFHYHELN